MAADERSWIRRLARRLLIERLGVVPRRESLRPYAAPGAARLLELRCALRLRRAPVLGHDEYAATAPVGEIEELVACPLCGERRVRPLFAPSRPGRWSYRTASCCVPSAG